MTCRLRKEYIMSNNNKVMTPLETIERQPTDIREVPENLRERLIISATKILNDWVITSQYGDKRWHLDGMPNNAPACRRYIDFETIPLAFVPIMKEVIYRYMRRGREGQKRPKGQSTIILFTGMRTFLRYLQELEITKLELITQFICTAYANKCREERIPSRNNKKLSPTALTKRLAAVEALYELSQYTSDPIPHHPWPDTSPKAMAGMTGKSAQDRASKTPLMPDSVFCTLFEKAYQELKNGHYLLNLRDALDDFASENQLQDPWTIVKSKKNLLARFGWNESLTTLKNSLINLGTSCYIVLASTSGCRNHELAEMKLGAHRCTEEDGLVYHWLRSNSLKTDTGIHDWMIPEAAALAIQIMERWARPYQALIATEVNHRNDINPQDPLIAQAIKHQDALFLGVTPRKSNESRTLSNWSWCKHLQRFSRAAGLDWPLNSHQFRRKFANYVAHSKFGDLRYLREHFAHWSMDMTLGYAMDDDWGQHLDLELYDDIQKELRHIKEQTVDDWINAKHLAGGYGQSIKAWQRDPANLALFKDHRTMIATIAESTHIRSNGHAWCTADNGGCIGNTLEKTRCGDDCNNAVIGRTHLEIYREMQRNLIELLKCNDLGEVGNARVLRDLERCRNVLSLLGADPEVDDNAS